MEHVWKIFTENCRKVWDERNLISLHRPIFVAFGLVVFLLTGTLVGFSEYAWFSNSIASRDSVIRIKDATIENLQNQRPSGASQVQNANRWEPLSPQESLSLRDNWRNVAPVKLGVLCAIPACADLAESIYDTAHDLDWPAMYSSTYFNDGIKNGAEIWSYPELIETRNKLADAIEHATNGRLKSSRHEWPAAPVPPDVLNGINLVIGRLK
jgi:hypothetical protein